MDYFRGPTSYIYGIRSGRSGLLPRAHILSLRDQEDRLRTTSAAGRSWSSLLRPYPIPSVSSYPGEARRLDCGLLLRSRLRRAEEDFSPVKEGEHLFTKENGNTLEVVVFAPTYVVG